MSLFRGVVTYHIHPATCGVARFNTSLSSSLGVPLIRLEDWLELEDKSRYFLSIKPSEFSEFIAQRFVGESKSGSARRCAVFFHEYNETECDKALTRCGKFFIAVDDVIAQAVRTHVDDVLVGFAPGMTPFPKGEFSGMRLISMGMAHKINLRGYELLNELAQRSPVPVELRLTAAVHEGFDVGEAMKVVPTSVRTRWSGDFKFLGFISDELMSEELRTCDAAVLFGQYGARQSSSSILGAMLHGKPVITLLDRNSPSCFRHLETIIDVAQLTEFPDASVLEKVATASMELASTMTFDELGRLIDKLG